MLLAGRSCVRLRFRFSREIVILGFSLRCANRCVRELLHSCHLEIKCKPESGSGRTNQRTLKFGGGSQTTEPKIAVQSAGFQANPRNELKPSRARPSLRPKPPNYQL